jgi:CubicO group peptidase (beta-lactamase class C family)
VKWQRALVGGKVVSAKSFEQMTTPDSLPGGRRMNYGFGLTVSQMGSKKVVAHGGGIFGFTTAGMFIPEDQINVAVFTNSEGGPDALAANIARAVMGIPLVTPPKVPVAVPLRDIDRDRIPGVYDFGQLVIRVTVEGGRLMAQAEGQGQGKFPLIHVGGFRFGAQVDPTLFITFVDENGKITKAQFTQRGSPPVEGTRKP